MKSAIRNILKVIIDFYKDFFSLIYDSLKNLILTDNALYRFMAANPALFGFIAISIASSIALAISLYDNLKEEKLKGENNENQSTKKRNQSTKRQWQN